MTLEMANTADQHGVFGECVSDVSGLPDGLVVNSGVGDDDQSGLLERSGDVVGEGTGGAVVEWRLDTVHL
jgi:hypothetical protein